MDVARRARQSNAAGRSVGVEADDGGFVFARRCLQRKKSTSRREKSKRALDFSAPFGLKRECPRRSRLGAPRDRARGTRRTSGGVQDHLQHRARTEGGADDVRDSLGFGEGKHGRSAPVVSSGRCQAICRRRRFDRQICAWPAVAFALCRREKRTFAAAMLLSCAVRPVSRLVLVSARVRERRARSASGRSRWARGIQTRISPSRRETTGARSVSRRRDSGTYS